MCDIGETRLAFSNWVERESEVQKCSLPCRLGYEPNNCITVQAEEWVTL